MLKTIQQQPAWLIPLVVMPLIIVFLLVVMASVPSKKKQVTTTPQATPEVVATPTPLPAISSLIYKNQQYSFQLLLPAPWEKKYAITENADSVVFMYAAEGAPQVELFTILIMPEETWRTTPDRSKLFLMSSRKGLVYAYSMPDKEGMLQDSSKSGQLAALMDALLLQEDVPKIAKTMVFE